MTDEEKKAWEELIYETKTLIPDAPILPKLLAADAELTALRSRLSLAEAVVEAVKNVDASMGMESFFAQKRILQDALRAYDEGKEGG